MEPTCLKITYIRVCVCNTCGFHHSLIQEGLYRMLNDINVGRELKSARIPESLIFNDK